MLDKELVTINYEGALYALGMSVPVDRVREVELEAAEDNDFNAAEGIRQAIEMWNNTDKNFNCKATPTYDDTTDD
tara:strand:- start:128 stop:352 length:225 start_codon:yes stop_codon:yes gene_type:complete